MNKLFIIILPLLIAVNAIGQLVTNSNITPTNLVQNVLLGNGVNAYNISYTGYNDAIGFFDGSNTNIGLSSGIIMTTGTVNNQTGLFGSQQGPFGPNDQSGAGYENGQPGDPQLDIYAGGSTENAAILEFDFQATGNTVSFNYVFASDEYPEFVNAGYNDVFAFWISGPGITGSQNIATIPGTSIPVSIDNVNAGSYSSYYISNGTGNSSPQNNDPTVVQYDGFTTVLTAQANVQCGETYHIRIAIADVGDESYDSGVFLEAQSFNSPSPMEVTSQITTVGNLSDNQLLEGCSNAIITFTRSDSINIAQTFSLTYSGSATNGLDYDQLPNTITFSPGQNTATLNLNTIYDNISEGTENLTITMLYSGACNQTTSVSITLTIVDNPPLSLSLPGNVDISCLTGASVELNPTVSGGTFPYYYTWNTGEQIENINVSPNDTTTYILTVTDACGNDTITDSITVNVIEFTPLSLSVSNDTAVYCPNSPVTLVATANGGAGQLSYLWNIDNLSDSIITVENINSFYYTVEVTDQCSNAITDSILVEVITGVLQTNTYGDTTICPFGDAVIGVSATDGTPGYRYEWDTGDTSSTITVSTPETAYIYVNVYDSCNTYFIRDSVLVSVQKPTANFYTNPPFGIEKKPVYFGNSSQNAITYFWDFGNGETSYQVNDYSTYENEGNYTVTLIAYDNLGCSDTVQKTFLVKPEFFGYIPNAFSPNGDGINDVFKGSFVGGKEVEMLIFDRWGKLIYEDKGTRLYWDGTYLGRPCPIDVYIYKFRVTDFENNIKEYTGHINLIR